MEEAKAMRDTLAKDCNGCLADHMVDRSMISKIDRTVVYFDTKATSTIDIKGEKRVSVRTGANSGKRATLCVTVSADSTKLPLFVIFKGVSDLPTAKSLPVLLPDGVYGCTQEKGWMDSRIMKTWFEKYESNMHLNQAIQFLLLD